MSLNRSNNDIEMAPMGSFKSRVQFELREYLKGISFYKTAGKARANAYLESIESIEDDQVLMRRVYLDVNQKQGKGRLDTSSDLRKILRGLLDQRQLTSDQTAPITLKEMLEETLDRYLLKSAGNSMKADGRERAKRYKAERLEQGLSENDLALQVYLDTMESQGKGLLHTSESLRKKLMMVLIKFKGLEKTLNKQVTDMVNHMAFVAARGGGAYVSGEDYFRSQAMPILLKATFDPNGTHLEARVTSQAARMSK